VEFFADLDRQLASDRGSRGEPSTNDFRVFDLLAIVERFATDFNGLLPELIPGRSDYRVTIATGAKYVVGVVELAEIEPA